ncbi:MAG: hypothetical protein DA330_01250, partial [Nitrososphaera sp.]|nr:hypothetical protein [Nitrososphaera sp.]
TARKINSTGSVKVLTDMDLDSSNYNEFLAIADGAGLALEVNTTKTYFPKNWKDQDFSPAKQPHTISLVLSVADKQLRQKDLTSS